jgi:hypothetical protein
MKALTRSADGLNPQPVYETLPVANVASLVMVIILDVIPTDNADMAVVTKASVATSLELSFAVWVVAVVPLGNTVLDRFVKYCNH